MTPGRSWRLKVTRPLLPFLLPRRVRRLSLRPPRLNISGTEQETTQVDETATEAKTAPREYTATVPETQTQQTTASHPSDEVSGEQGQYARSVTFDESQNKSQEAPTEYTEGDSATETATQTGTATQSQPQTQPSHPSDEISGMDQYTGTGTTTYDYGTRTATAPTQTGETEQTGEEGTAPTGESVTVAEDLDFSVLKGGKVNKGGNVIDSDGKIVGRVVSGILQYLVGKKVDENGDIWSDNGKVIGKAEPISDSERDDMLKEPAPFESFPDALEDMPHAKKELNPLWGLLNEPLFQILAAVGLLLSGVLNLVGRLLGGLGLGGLVDGLLGTLGLNRVLEGLGLGSVTKSLTGAGKKKNGGLLGLGG
ncbi:hypothetical protein B0T20DRAFT_211221 [Sordaria brevicollis]|uniref:DUF6987 domain-containing protein n=1 Tax=Sordaria brevicollis TaxID=83679 RepID=A0AAE0PEM0_SORBR|nr:hypothetical protein B0T20DRAFT_211221 [Sordaria brevicollis]